MTTESTPADAVSMTNSSFLAYHREEMELQRDEKPCAACGLPMPADDLGDACSEGCDGYLSDMEAEAVEPDGKDYSDLEGN